MRDDMEQTKKCRHCGRVLPASAFYRRTKSPTGLQSWCKECMKNRLEENAASGNEKINLDHIKKEILMYRNNGHSYGEVARWINRNYHIQCGTTTLRRRVARWLNKGKPVRAEIPVKVEEYIAKPAVLVPATLTDFNDADIIQELRMRGYRVFSERYIKKWGNHYKKQLIEITQ